MCFLPFMTIPSKISGGRRRGWKRPSITGFTRDLERTKEKIITIDLKQVKGPCLLSTHTGPSKRIMERGGTRRLSSCRGDRTAPGQLPGAVAKALIDHLSAKVARKTASKPKHGQQGPGSALKSREEKQVVAALR